MMASTGSFYRINVEMHAFPRGNKKTRWRVACHCCRDMGYPLLVRMLRLVLVMTIGMAIDARAGDNDVSVQHIRSSDRELRALIDDALATSPTVRELVERITASDVVVYVACETEHLFEDAGQSPHLPAGARVRADWLPEPLLAKRSLVRHEGGSGNGAACRGGVEGLAARRFVGHPFRVPALHGS